MDKVADAKTEFRLKQWTKIIHPARQAIWQLLPSVPRTM